MQEARDNISRGKDAFLDLNYLNDDWDWNHISRYISMPDARRSPTLPWDKYHLSMNREITLDDALHLDLPNSTGEWNWSEVRKRSYCS